jgi:type I restriction enzyme, S subunit
VIGDLKPYRDMRAIALPGLSYLPQHWQTGRARDVADLLVSNVDKIVHDDEQPVRLCNYVDIYKNRAIHGNLDFMRGSASELEISKFRIRVSDVIITKDSEDWKDIGVPALVAYEAPDLVCGYHLAILRPRSGKMDGRFLFWQLLGAHARWQFAVRSTGVTRYGLSQGSIKSIQLAVPPLDEQRLIASFLEFHGAMADRLVRSKKRLIALLNEQKRSIVHRAVIHGLDPHAKMRPSGVDAIGDVPAHWVVKSLKWLAEINPASLGQRTDPDYEFDYVDIGCVGTGYLVNEPERLRFSTAPARARRIVDRNDTLVSTVRTYLKAIYFVADPWPDLIASTGFAVLRPRAEVNAAFFGHALESGSFIDQVMVNSDGVAYPAINEARLGALKIALPPSQDEQVAIITHLDAETLVFERSMAALRREITLIEELRTRLIADVVVGRIDVRAEAANLPGPGTDFFPDVREAEGEEFPA